VQGSDVSEVSTRERLISPAWKHFVKRASLSAVFCGLAMLAAAQTNAPKPNDPLEALRSQMQELRVALNDVRDQLAASRVESKELRQELADVRQQLATPKPQDSGIPDLTSPAEERQLLRAEIEDQYQTKVESGSKYRVRLSGLAVLNVFSTRGAVDSLDVPKVATTKAPGDSNGTFGATARQSQLGLHLLGPQWGSAKTTGDLAFDFFGGFPANSEGVTAGLVRLRTAKLTLDWANTTVMAGQDTPFFSPLSPTSLASLAYPALASSGNLWTWTPQAYVEHRLVVSDGKKVVLQAGVLDPLTGELPVEYNRAPTAGNRSRAPAAAARLALQSRIGERLATIGAGGYYSRQNWGFGQMVDAWAATVDWDLPLGPWFSLSGEAYRGKSIGGLGGGVSGSVLFKTTAGNGGSSVLPLSSAGGWSQVKFKPAENFEFNAAFGGDVPFRSGLGTFLAKRTIEGSPSSRNVSAFVNWIYQPRSNLMFSVEYRRLWTSGFYDPRQRADHVSVSSGVVF